MLLQSAVALRMVVLVAAPTLPAPAEQVDLESDQFLLSYEAVFGAHQVSGVSRALEWSTTTLPDGSAQVRLRVAADSFESGHEQLDAELRRAIDSKRFPTIDIEGIVKAGKLPAAFEGTVTLHGVTRPLSASISLARIGARVAVRTGFSIDLRAFGIARPSIGSTPVQNKIAVEFMARLRVHPRSVVSGGVVHSSLSTPPR